jgi:hypothetical protein
MDWKSFFDKLGMNGTQWQWRILRWQKSWNAFLDGFRHKEAQVTVEAKFCPECRAMQ